MDSPDHPARPSAPDPPLLEVAVRDADSLELIREMGVGIDQIRLSGGGARNPLWRQIQADIYGGDVHTLNSNEGPAFGAALLAQVEPGAFRSVPEASTPPSGPWNRPRSTQGQGVLRQVVRGLPETLSRSPRIVPFNQRLVAHSW